MAAAGAFTFDPCHHHHAVGPMRGYIRRLCGVHVRNDTFGNVTYATQNEGLGRCCVMAPMANAVLAHLKWMERNFTPALVRALELTGL